MQNCYKLNLSKTIMVGAIASSLLVGCESVNSPAPSVPQQTIALKTPTKEILIFEGDTSRAYVVVGNVDCKLEKGVAYGSTLEVPMEAQKSLKDELKRVAFTKYGEKVDAIINVKMGKEVGGGFFGTVAAAYGAKNTIVSATGVAVSYSGTKDTK